MLKTQRYQRCSPVLEIKYLRWILCACSLGGPVGVTVPYTIRVSCRCIPCYACDVCRGNKSVSSLQKALSSLEN